MKIRRWGALMVALTGMAVSACSPLDALDTLVPDDTYEATLNISYGSEARHRLDVYRPLDVETPTLVVVFFYGGNWKGGERGQYRFVGEALASRGLTVVVPDVRLYPEVQYPAFLEDGAEATAWVLREIGEYGGDPERVFLAGHSAGGYNAAMLAVNPRYLQAAGASPSQLCGVVTLAGPISFNPFDYTSTRPVFASADNPEATRAINYVSTGDPPFLLLHGLADSTVYPKNSIEFAEAMRAAGNTVDLQLLPEIGHYRIIAAVSDPFENWFAPVSERIATFVDGKGS